MVDSCRGTAHRAWWAHGGSRLNCAAPVRAVAPHVQGISVTVSAGIDAVHAVTPATITR